MLKSFIAVAEIGRYAAFFALGMRLGRRQVQQHCQIDGQCADKAFRNLAEPHEHQAFW
jgi:hypothetical protein